MACENKEKSGRTKFVEGFMNIFGKLTNAVKSIGKGDRKGK